MSFENWAVVKLGDHTIIKGGKRLPKGKNLLVQKTKHPYIRLVDIQNGKVIKDNLMYLDDTTYDGISRYVVKTGDVCLAIVGHTIGLVFYITDEFDGANLTENAVKIECKSDLNSKYLYYYLISGQGQHQIKIRTVGSAQGKLPIYNVRDIDIPLPSLEEQENISLVLSALDDKIELNNAINKNLEEMAQALFKQWFVDFEFPNENGEPYKSSGGEFEESELGLIPKGWRVLNLEEIIEINPKRVLKKGQTSSYVEMKSLKNNYARVSEYVMRKFSSGSRFANGDVLLARITPCLENGKTAYVDFLKNDEVGWGSTEFIVMRSRPPISSEFSYFLARSEQFRSHAILSMTGSSGRQRVPESSLSKYQIALPLVGELISTFEGLTKSALKLMKKNDDESKRLAQIRDTLLPKLISGEIRVPIERELSAQELPMVAESGEVYQN